MAVLPDPDRAASVAEFIRECSDERTAIEITKADLRAALNAIDAWLETNKTSLNNAIPLPGRTSLTTPQKAKLLMHVVRKRYVTGV